MLGRLLADDLTTSANIAHALEVYQYLRLRPSQQAAERSRENGWMYDFNHPDFDFRPEKGEPTLSQLKKLGAAVGESFEWLAQGGCEEDWELGSRLLKEGRLPAS